MRKAEEETANCCVVNVELLVVVPFSYKIWSGEVEDMLPPIHFLATAERHCQTAKKVRAPANARLFQLGRCEQQEARQEKAGRGENLDKGALVVHVWEIVVESSGIAEKRGRQKDAEGAENGKLALPAPPSPKRQRKACSRPWGPSAMGGAEFTKSAKQRESAVRNHRRRENQEKWPSQHR